MQGIAVSARDRSGGALDIVVNVVSKADNAVSRTPIDTDTPHHPRVEASGSDVGYFDGVCPRQPDGPMGMG